MSRQLGRRKKRGDRKRTAPLRPDQIGDVAELRRALRESESRYRRLLDAVTHYAYAVHFENGEAVLTQHGAGAASVTGYLPTELDSDPFLWIEMVHPEDRDTVLEHARRVLGDDVDPIEHRIMHRDGSTRWVRSTIIRHVESGNLVRYDGILEDITHRRRIEQALRDNELQLLAAQKIQEHLLPTEAPRPAGYDIGAALYPAEFAAGDYYDYLTLGDNGLALVIGDVTGHGFASALIMSLTQMLMRLLAEAHDDVPQVLRNANSVLSRATDEYHFVTLFFGRLDPVRQELVFSSAGHPPGYVLDREGSVKQMLESTSHPLGMFPDIAFPSADPVPLTPGDTVVLVTDGIEEARNAQFEHFGRQRLVEIVRRHRDQPAEQIAKILCRSAREFAGRLTPEDDTTVVVVRVLD